MRSSRCPRTRTVLLALCLATLPALAPPAASAASALRTQASETAPAETVRVTGTISLPEGAKLSAPVQATAYTPAGAQVASAPVAQDGTWQLDLPVGSLVLVAHPLPPSAYGGVPVTVQAGAQTPPVTLPVVADNTTGTVYAVDGSPTSSYVSVLDAAGKPLPWYSGPAGQDGAFSLALPDGTHVLEAAPHGPGVFAARGDVSVSGGAAAAPVPLRLLGPNLVLDVRDPQGEQVQAGWTLQTAGGESVPAQGQPLSDGTQAVRGPEGTFTLRVHTYGSPLVADPVQVTLGSDRQALTVRLRAARLTGGVTAGGKAWAGGGDVQFVNAQGWWEPGLPSGVPLQSDGTFSVDAPAGSYHLQVTPPAGQPFVQTLQAVTVVAEGSVVSVALDAADVGGTVTRPDGTPAGLGQVDLQPSGGGQGRTVLVGSDGRWTARVPSGTWTLTARPGNGAPFAPATRSVVVDANGYVTADLALQAPNLTGTVVEPDLTTAFTGASLAVQTESGQHVSFTNVDQDGRFHLKLEPGTYVLRAEPYQGAFTTGTTRVTVGEQVQDVKVVLTQPNVRGTVKTKTGAYTGQGWVSVLGSDGAYVGGAQIDPTGAFRLNLKDGTYTLTAQPWSSGTYVPTSTTLVVDQPSETAEIVLEAPNLTGRVLTPKGVPVAWSPVEVTNAQGHYVPGAYASTDADGRYALRLAAGTYTLTARPSHTTSGLAAGKVTVTVLADGTVQQDIALTEPNLSGSVQDPDGRRVANVYVEVHDLTRNTWVPGAWSPDGSYALNLPAGRYRLTARPPYGSSGLTSAVQEVALVKDGAPVSQDLTLRRPNLTGTVRTSSGTVAHSFVDVTTPDGRWVEGAYASTGFDGTYALSLPAGDYDLTARPAWGDTSGAVPTTVRVTVGASGTTTQDVVLAAANLTGTVKVGTQVQPDSFVDVVHADGDKKGQQVRGAWASTNAEGEFALRIPDGTGAYTLTARPSWRNPSGAVATTVPLTGPQTSLVVELAKANVTGRVTAGSELPNIVRGSFVDVRDDEGNQIAWAVTGEDGSYGLKLADGSYTLTARPGYDTRTGYAETSVPLTVANGSGSANVALASVNVSGAVVDTDGAPVAHVPVRAVAGSKVVATTWTDANGAFALALAGGPHELQADAPYDNPKGLAGGSAQVTAPAAQPVTITLSAGNTRGVVLDANGERVPNAPVTVYGADGKADPTSSTATDKNGEFTVSLPHGSTAELQARPPVTRQSDKPSPRTTVTAGTGSTGLELRFAS